MVKVFVPKELGDGETRVAATPETIKKMAAKGLEVSVQREAGLLAHVVDADYENAGATLVDDRTAALGEADIVLTVNGLAAAEAQSLKAGAVLVGLLAPHANIDTVRALQDWKVSALAMELVPRISRAQSMDALSSQASIAGYKAVLLAATRLGKYFPLLMTAAGTIKPAGVVILGAGVAGLLAVATAKRLGAVVEVSDIREVVKEQVESLGGKFIELPDMGESGEGEGGYAKQVTPEFLAEQRKIVTRHIAQADVVICTALVPGRKAPILVTESMVDGMKAGAIIVDLAVGQGGNCELSAVGQDVRHGGVLILGPANLPAETPFDASQLYARNVWALLEPTLGEEGIALDLEDEVIDGALLTHGGEVRHAPTRDLLAG
ncbi:MAG: NAD(P) transhydrogenase subunit alpha [Acidobacteriota bacterium]